MKSAAPADDGRTFAAERELRYEVFNLAKRIRGDSKAHPALLRRLERMVGTAQPSWLKSGATCAAIAVAYGELGRLDEAVKYYERALTAESASSTVQAIEQLANLLSRGASRQEKPLLDVMKRSTELLQNLTALGKTGERLSLLGGTAKRYAQKASGRARMQALKEMSKTYKDGYEVAVKNEPSKSWYPLSNAVAGRLAITWQPGAPKNAAAGIKADMSELEKLVKKVPASSTDFWELAFPADMMLLRAAVKGQLTASDRKAVEAAYRAAVMRGGTQREGASATGQIEFLRDLARSSNRAPIKRLAESLEELRKALEGEDSK